MDCNDIWWVHSYPTKEDSSWFDDPMTFPVVPSSDWNVRFDNSESIQQITMKFGKDIHATQRMTLSFYWLHGLSSGTTLRPNVQTLFFHYLPSPDMHQTSKGTSSRRAALVALIYAKQQQKKLLYQILRSHKDTRNELNPLDREGTGQDRTGLTLQLAQEQLWQRQQHSHQAEAAAWEQHLKIWLELKLETHCL